MNSNNLELSLIENEIEKISSKYHLRGQQQQEGCMSQGIKSPSVLTFGGQTMSQGELTLNKQGKIPSGKDVKPGALPKINPKELSNEELEYIIKTGKLPPKYQQEPLQASQYQQQPLQVSQYHQQQQNMPMMQKVQEGGNMGKTSQQLPQLQSYMIHDKENEQNLKNYNSPRMMSDYLVQKQTLNTCTNPFTLSQPVMLPTQASFQLDQSYNKSIDTLNQSTSQAASHALKALQDRVKSLEKENGLLQDKLSITESSQTEHLKKLQQKLREETEKAAMREQSMREECSIMKRQLETVECEKLRHLEENSSEREQWRQQYKRVEEENLMLKRQMQDQLERYNGIEETIMDIKRREALLRDRQEKEVQHEKDRVREIEAERDEDRRRYEELKGKMSQKAKSREQELMDIKEDYAQSLEQKEQEVTKLQREVEKWKRESQMLKEELQILAGGARVQEKKSRITVGKSSMPGDTPKASSRKVAEDESKSRTQGLNSTAQQFQSIDTDKSVKKSHKKGEQKSHRKTPSNIGTVAKETLQSNKEAKRVQSSDRKSASRKRGQSSAKHPKKESKVKKSRHEGSVSKSRQETSTSQQRQPSQHALKSRSERSLNGVQSQQNLISINTRQGVAESVKLDQENTIFSGRPGLDSQEFILVDSYDGIMKPQRAMSSQRLNESLGQQSTQSMNNNKFNQYKRTSVETGSQFGGTNSEYGLMMYSHQSSIDQQANDVFNKRPLDLTDFQSDKTVVDNEIFYLEREIFDYNQQYKSLLTQQTNSNTSYQVSTTSNDTSTGTVNLNQKLRQIAQQLEEKSERLFELKKQQQQHMLRESYKNPFVETGIKAYQFN